MTNVQVPKPDRCADISSALHLLAVRFADLIGSGVPVPFVQLSIQPGKHGDDESITSAVNAVTSALLFHAGQVQEMSRGGGYHYNNGDSAELVGAVGVRIFNSVSPEFAVKRKADADLAAKEAELARLRAEVEKLRAESGLSYSRADEADDPTPVSPARVPPHTGAVTDGGLVDETAGAE